MNAEEKFLEAIRELNKRAKRQGNRLSAAEMEEFWEEFELTEEQKPAVSEYLASQKIVVMQADYSEDVNEETRAKSDETDSEYLTMYYDELVELPKLSDGEKKAICMSALAGDAEGKERLIQMFLPQVIDIARLYEGQGVLIEDLIGEGNVALSTSVLMLPMCEKPEEVEGFLGNAVMEAMENYIEEETGAKKTNRKVVELTNKVEEASKELANDIGRKVTVEELVREGKVSERQIRLAMLLSSDHMDYIEGATDATV